MIAKTGRESLDALIVQLLAERAGSICPSEVARAASPEWRALMPRVREAAARLAKKGRVVVTQKRTVVDALQAKGPIRIRASAVPSTPDGKYIVVRGRLWRKANPHLAPSERETLVRTLMAARRSVGESKRRGDDEAVRRARRRVDAAKRKLGERGPVWWTDGAPDYNRKLVLNTPYAAWWQRRDSD